MSEWRPLKDVQIDAEKKQRDFDKITVRLHKQSLPWQVPVVMLGVVMLSFFLFLTWSEPREVIADTEPELTAVYHLYGEGNPFSIWQMWVTRSTDPDVLEIYEGVLVEAKQVEPPRLTEVSETYRFVYSDGTFSKYETYYEDGQTYFVDRDSGEVYEIADTTGFYSIATMDGYSDAKNYAWLLIGALTLYFILNYLVGRKLRDAEDKKKSLPQHSTHWQKVIIVVAFALIAVLALALPNLHYAVAIFVLGLAMLINIWLERKFGQNSWRMLRFVVDSFWYTAILMNFFLM